jgi:hypothetical protein
METEQIMEMLKAMQAKAEADREVLKGIMDANTKSMREDIKSGQEEMRPIICAIRSELEGTTQHEMKGVLSYVDQKTQNLRRELRQQKRQRWNYRQ